MLKYCNFQKKRWIKIVFEFKLLCFITKSVTQHPYNISQQFSKGSTKSGTAIKPFLRRYKNGWFLVEMFISGLLETSKPTDLIIWDMASILGGFVRRGWGLILHASNGSCTINEVTRQKFLACAMLKYGNFQNKRWIKIVFPLKLLCFITKSVTRHPYNIFQQFGRESTKSGTSIKPFLRRYKNGWFLVEMVISGLLETNKPTDLIICDMASILVGFCRKWMRFDFAYSKWIMPD